MTPRKKLTLLLAAGLLCLPLSACAPQPVTESFFAMDTYMTLTVSGKRATEALAAARSEVEALEGRLSVTRPDSEVAGLNAAGHAAVSDDTAELISLACSLSRRSSGAFDITVSPLVAAWGFYDDAFRVPDPAELEELCGLVDSGRIRVEGGQVTLGAGQRIDLGGIAKGYASRQLCRILDEYGVESALLSLGGSVLTTGPKSGGKPWIVAVQDPDRADGYLGTLESQYEAIVTSGDYQRCFERDGRRYHHILDPATGAPADSGLRSVTVVCADPVEADAFSTALFVMGEADAVAFWRAHSELELILYTGDGRLLVSEGLAERFHSALAWEALKR